MKNLSDIAYKVANLQIPMKVIVNYLDCIKHQAIETKNSRDKTLVLCSLVNRQGLDNVIETLEMLSDQAEELTDLILDYANEEEGTDDE